MTISISATASRTSGVAPLAVWVDMTGTTATGFTYPFHQLFYSVDWGDTNAGTWAYGSGRNTSKNKSYGPHAFHVYETPGSYTATVSVFDGTNTATTTIGVTVTDPATVFSGTATICFSQTGDFTGAPTNAKCVGTGAVGTYTNLPAGATTLQDASIGAYDHIIATYAATTTRLLLCAGQTFTVAASNAIGVIGPGHVGKFGSGANPILQATADLYGGVLLVASSKTDWRFADLTIAPNGHNVVMAASNPSASNILWLRTSGDKLSGFYSYSPGTACDHHFFVDCAVTNFNDTGAASEGTFTNITNYLAFGGCNWYDYTPGTSTQNMCRLQNLTGLIVSNCQFYHPTAGRNLLSIRGDNNFAGVTCIQQVIVSDSDFLLGGGTNGGLGFTDPGNSGKTPSVIDCIAERNYHGQCTATNGLAYIDVSIASQLTLRNNATDGGSITIDDTFISLGGNTLNRSVGQGITGPIWIYNNSWHSISATNGTSFLTNQGNIATAPVTVQNNAAYCPNSTAGSWVLYKNASSITNLTQDHNSWGVTGGDASMHNNPSFLNGTGAYHAMGDFGIPSGSYLVAKGTSGAAATSSLYDASLLVYPSTAVDIGAFQYPPDSPVTVLTRSAHGKSLKSGF